MRVELRWNVSSGIDFDGRQGLTHSLDGFGKYLFLGPIQRGYEPEMRSLDEMLVAGW